jgi:hypothetical protein
LRGEPEGENRSHVERVEGVGEHDPEGEGLGPAVREADETVVSVSEFVKQGHALDGLEPGIRVSEE